MGKSGQLLSISGIAPATILQACLATSPRMLMYVIVPYCPGQEAPDHIRAAYIALRLNLFSRVKT